MTSPDRDYDDIVRRALHAIADPVEPAGDGLTRIRQRIAEPWARRQISLLFTDCVDLGWLVITRSEPGVARARSALAAGGKAVGKGLAKLYEYLLVVAIAAGRGVGRWRRSRPDRTATQALARWWRSRPDRAAAQELGGWLRGRPDRAAAQAAVRWWRSRPDRAAAQALARWWRGRPHRAVAQGVGGWLRGRPDRAAAQAAVRWWRSRPDRAVAQGAHRQRPGSHLAAPTGQGAGNRPWSRLAVPAAWARPALAVAGAAVIVVAAVYMITPLRGTLVLLTGGNNTPTTAHARGVGEGSSGGGANGSGWQAGGSAPSNGAHRSGARNGDKSQPSPNAQSATCPPSPTPTASNTPTSSPTPTPSPTPSGTPTPTPTPTASPSPSVTGTSGTPTPGGTGSTVPGTRGTGRDEATGPEPTAAASVSAGAAYCGPSRSPPPTP